MVCHKIGGGWVLTLPDSYSAEYVKDDRVYKFCDSETDTAIRVSPLKAEKNGKPVPKEALKNAFAHSLDSIEGRAALREDDHELGNGFSAMAFEYTYFSAKNELLFFISYGIYCDGALLSIQINSNIRENCEEALEYIKNIYKE